MAAIEIARPQSDFPELVVKVPSSWPYIILEPLYDVHLGNNLHAAKQFSRDVDRISKQRYTLSWDGGDIFENSVIGSPDVFGQDGTPHEQFDTAVDVITPILAKMLFKIKGNHEGRTWRNAGFDIARALAEKLGLEYFPDYCFLTIKWRRNSFRIVAHHGSGASATPGGQRNAARKDMPWTHADLYWTGHLHQPMADLIFQTCHNQRTDRMFSRPGFAIISPSYVKYFGGYAAAKRLGPGALGTSPVTLYPDGTIVAALSARGRRL